ncbi:hypothetical protein P9112_004747 [Eukaryota sp. TZLM1-RC]
MASNQDPWIIYVFIGIAWLIKLVAFVLCLPLFFVLDHITRVLSHTFKSTGPFNLPVILLRFVLCLFGLGCFIFPGLVSFLLLFNWGFHLNAVIVGSLSSMLLTYSIGFTLRNWRYKLFSSQQCPDVLACYTTALLDPLLFPVSLFPLLSVFRTGGLLHRLSNSKKHHPEDYHIEWRFVCLLTFIEVPIAILSIPFILVLSVTIVRFSPTLITSLFIVPPSSSYFSWFAELVSECLSVVFGLLLFLISTVFHLVLPHRIFILSKQIPSIPKDKFLDNLVGFMLSNSLQGLVDVPCIIASIPVLFSWRSPVFVYKCLKWRDGHGQSMSIDERRKTSLVSFAQLFFDILVLPFTIINFVTIYRIPRIFSSFQFSQNSYWTFHFSMIYGFFNFILDVILIPFVLINLLSWKRSELISFWKKIRIDYHSSSLGKLNSLEFSFFCFALASFFYFLVDVFIAFLGVLFIIPTMYRIPITFSLLKSSVNWHDAILSQVGKIIVEIPFILMGFVVILTWRSVSLIYQVFSRPKVYYIETDDTPSAPDLNQVPNQSKLIDTSPKSSFERRCYVFDHFIRIFTDVILLPFFLFLFLTVFRLPKVFYEAYGKVGDKCNYFGGLQGLFIPIISNFFKLLLDFPFILFGFPVLISWRRKSLFDRINKAPSAMWARFSVFIELYYLILDLPAFLLIVLVFVTRWRWGGMKMAMAEGNCVAIDEDTDERNVKFTSRWHSCVYHEAFLWLVDIIIFVFSLPLRLSCWRRTLYTEIYLNEELTEGEKKVLVAKEFGKLCLDLPVLIVLVMSFILSPWRIPTLIRDIQETTLKEGIHSPIVRQFYEGLIDLPHVVLLLPLCLWRIPVTIYRGLYDEKFGMSAQSRRVLVWKELSYMFMDIFCLPLGLALVFLPWRWPFIFKTAKSYQQGLSEHKLVLLEFIYGLMDIPLVLLGLICIFRYYCLITRLVDTNTSGFIRRKAIFRLIYLTPLDVFCFALSIVLLITWKSFKYVKKVFEICRYLNQYSKATSRDKNYFYHVFDAKTLQIHSVCVKTFVRFIYELIMIIELIISTLSLLSIPQVITVIKSFFLQFNPLLIKHHHFHTTKFSKIPFANFLEPNQCCALCTPNSDVTIHSIGVSFTNRKEFFNSDDIGPFLIDDKVSEVLMSGLESYIHYLFLQSLINFLELILIPFKLIGFILGPFIQLLLKLMSKIPYYYLLGGDEFFQDLSKFIRLRFVFASMELVFFTEVLVSATSLFCLISSMLSFLFDLFLIIGSFGFVFKSPNYQERTYDEIGKAFAFFIIILNFIYFVLCFSILSIGFLSSWLLIPALIFGIFGFIIHYNKHSEHCNSSWWVLSELCFVVVGNSVKSTGCSVGRVLSSVFVFVFKAIFSVFGLMLWFIFSIFAIVANFYSCLIGIPTWLSFKLGGLGQLTITVFCIYFAYFPVQLAGLIGNETFNVIAFFWVIVNVSLEVWLVPRNWRTEPLFIDLLRKSFDNPRQYILF